MFKHQGKNRTHKHNIQIATVLSFIAGLVNVVGFLSLSQMTTNITGHFTSFMINILETDFNHALTFSFYIISFLFGSFVSSFIIEMFKENKKLNIYVLPILIECGILLTLSIMSNFIDFTTTNTVIFILLFVMGLQNSMVTKISNAVVRTTHLTGLITDLGIDLSHTLFSKFKPNKEHIQNNIKLRLFIILSFFIGGIIGGLTYTKLGFKINTLFIPVIILIITLFYDDISVKESK